MVGTVIGQRVDVTLIRPEIEEKRLGRLMQDNEGV